MTDQDSHPNEIKDNLIKKIFAKLGCYLEESNSLKTIDKKDTDQNLKMLFIKYACNSCIGNMENLYKSFNDILIIDNIIRDISYFKDIITEIDDLNNTEIESKIESQKNKEEIIRRENICTIVHNYLAEVNSEFNDLNSDPQFKEINQLESKTRKKTDKAERTNQIFIHDLIYFIDRMNRQISMKTLTKQ